MFCHTAEIHKVYAFAYTVTDFLEEDSFPKKMRASKSQNVRKKDIFRAMNWHHMEVKLG